MTGSAGSGGVGHGGDRAGRILGWSGGCDAGADVVCLVRDWVRRVSWCGVRLSTG